MTSILTNNGAMVALQTLKSINNNLEQTQSEISTGKKVASAKDNAAIWSISKVMESDVEGFKSISDALTIGEGTVSVARNAAETTTDLLKQMKEKIIAAQDGTVDRATLQEDIVALRNQITSVVDAAQFNGVNLVNGVAVENNAGGADGIDVISSLDRAGAAVTASRISVDRKDLTIATLGVGAIDVTTDTATAQAALGTIETAIQTAVDVSASFGSTQMRIEIQNEFVNKLADTLTSGIGSMVDADMEEASAKLKALQTQQQLGVQSLSIANQAPGAIMSLFR